MHRAYAKSADGQIHYADEGSGPALLLVHHTGRSLDYYRPLYPLLKDKFRLIAADMPGFGNSDARKNPLTVELTAARLIAVANPLHIDKFHLFGPHPGAAVAIAMASTYPARVSRLAMMAVPLMPEEKRDKFLAALEHRSAVSEDGAQMMQLWNR